MRLAHTRNKSDRLLGGLHPATWLICWVAFLFLVGRFFLPALAVACLVLWLAALCGDVPVGPAMRRIRWVLTSGLLIYAFATPGTPLWTQLGIFSPTVEGLKSGTEQLLRLAAAVLSLTLLMTRLQPAGVLTALDSLLAPLRWLGRNPERLIARLWLTLHFVQPRRAAPLSTILQQLRSLPAGDEDFSVTLERRSFRYIDMAVLLACTATMLLSLQ